jgi:hypothetical protein
VRSRNKISLVVVVTLIPLSAKDVINCHSKFIGEYKQETNLRPNYLKKLFSEVFCSNNKTGRKNGLIQLRAGIKTPFTDETN